MSTKTVEQKKAASVYERLHRKIKKHSGMDDDQIVEAGEHGADAGWPGFTYTADTVAFFRKHRAAIVELVIEMADGIGETPLDLVAGFNCLAGRETRRSYNHSFESDRKRQDALSEYYPSVSRCLYGGRLTDDDSDVANALAWFALEEIGCWLESERERIAA